jgi:type IV fimbrial biogenesis protein FimT
MLKELDEDCQSDPSADGEQSCCGNRNAKERRRAIVVNEVGNEVGGRVGRWPVGRSEGYTMIQIVVTLAVVSTLAVMALPTTTNALRNYRLSAAVAAATGAISATRYQAIMHAYPYSITFNAANASYQVASEPPGAMSFTNLPGGAVPLAGVGDVTINQTTTLQFNANGTVSATTGTMSFTISDPVNTKKMHTITVSGVGDVSSN